jgi:hypothetical protein
MSEDEVEEEEQTISGASGDPVAKDALRANAEAEKDEEEDN